MKRQPWVVKTHKPRSDRWSWKSCMRSLAACSSRCVNREPHQMRSNRGGRFKSLKGIFDKSGVTEKFRRQKSKALLSISAAVISELGNLARRNLKTRPYPLGKSRIEPSVNSLPAERRA